MAPATFTLRDELRASPTIPLPRADWQDRIRWARVALEALRNPGRATWFHWNVLSLVCNFMVSLVALGLAQDPDGLLYDAVAAMDAAKIAANARDDRTGSTIALSGADFDALAAVVDDYAECLPALPARFAIRAMRRTERLTRDAS